MEKKGRMRKKQLIKKKAKGARRKEKEKEKEKSNRDEGIKLEN